MYSRDKFKLNFINLANFNTTELIKRDLPNQEKQNKMKKRSRKDGNALIVTTSVNL